MFKALLTIFNLFFATLLMATETEQHPMQHGFILAKKDTFATHLVASGHHSRQVSVWGKLKIIDKKERYIYVSKRKENKNQFYYLFQAQHLDLPSLKVGETLKGHIVESKVGSYQPGNKIVSEAEFKVEYIFINLLNPFFLN